jgi:DNA-binding SARP family transcriptional activator
MVKLSVFLLGDPLIERDGRRIHMERHKSLALLAYLTVTGTAHQRDELATLLWPELGQLSARAALRRTLSTLKISLAGNWLEADRDTIQITPSTTTFWSDVAQFHGLLARCRQHGHPETEVCDECLPSLTEAGMLYRGDFLTGFSLRDAGDFDDWQFEQAETFRRELAGVQERLVRGNTARKDYEPAISAARRWLALDPLHEPAARQLMQLYAWTGQRNTALRQYAECVRLLERELGVPPQVATTELYDLIKGDRLPPPVAEPSAPAPAPIVQMREVPGTKFENGFPGEVDRVQHAVLDRIVRGQLVGRERELAEATSLWSRAASGETQVLLMSGEPGIGKTRLVRELARVAQVSEGIVLTGGCHAEGEPPYSPLAKLIREATENQIHINFPEFILADLLTLAPHLRPYYPHIQPNPALDPWFEQQRVFDSFAAWCEMLANHAPLLIIVEDVHWASGGTLALLRHLVRRVRKARLLLVMTYRDIDVELDPAHPLKPVLLELQRERLAKNLQLAPLDREHIRDMLAALLSTPGADITTEFIDSLYNETEGNPFFIEEVCKGLIEQGKLYHAGGIWRRADMQTIFIPPSVRSSIMARVEHLPASTQETLRLAAILGREFDIETLHGASAQNEDKLITALERAERAQLIEEFPHAGRAAYIFAHALIPFALRESLSSLRRQHLHHRVATAIENLHPDDVEALAHHFTAAARRDKAIHYSRQAAQRAKTIFDYEAAVQHLQTALDFMEAGEPVETHLVLLEDLGDAYNLSGRQEDAILRYREALNLFQNPKGDANKWTCIRLHRKIGESFNRLAARPELRQFNDLVLAGFENALKMIEGEPPHPESVRLLATLANYGYWSSIASYQQIETLSDKGEHYARAAIKMAEQLDTPAELSAALDSLASVYSTQGKLHERLAITLRRLEISRDPRFTDPGERLDILRQVGFALCSVGEYADALTYLREAELLADKIRNLNCVINVLEIQAQCLFGLDRWEEVLQVEDKRPALQAKYGSTRVGRICRQCGVSAYIHGLRGEMELSRFHREEAANMMTSAWGPLENWPAIGHF